MLDNSKKVISALEFATKAHKNQFRWDNTTPYIEHPKTVVALLKSWKMENEETLQAAYLHDVIEDTDVTSNEIMDKFGLTVAGLVVELTRGKDEDYWEHCNRMSKVAALIKVADIISNISDLTSKKSPRYVDKRLFALTILQKKTQELV